MLVDYHMHLEPDSHVTTCPWHREQLEAYLRIAEQRGVAEIGITEHCNRFRAFWPLFEPIASSPGCDPGIAAWLRDTAREELDRYVSLIVAAQEAGLPVRLGIEVDYVPGWEAFLAEVLAPYPWDYVLGSVHFLGDWVIDASPEVGWPQRDVDEAYETYFSTLQAAARSGLFDVLAHPDLIKKFGHRPRGNVTPLLDQTVAALQQSGVCIEVSTAGLHKPVAEMYPGPALLARCQAAGIPITLASDAHEPEHVGRDLGQAVTLAWEAGYRHFCRLIQRQRRLAPLPGNEDERRSLHA